MRKYGHRTLGFCNSLNFLHSIEENIFVYPNFHLAGLQNMGACYCAWFSIINQTCQNVIIRHANNNRYLPSSQAVYLCLTLLILTWYLSCASSVLQPCKESWQLWWRSAPLKIQQRRSKKNRGPGLQSSRNFRLERKVVNIVSDEPHQRIAHVCRIYSFRS